MHPFVYFFVDMTYAAIAGSGFYCSRDYVWPVSSRSGEACCELLYPVTYLLTYLLTCSDVSERTRSVLNSF